ncbi:MAG: RidA family protein [Alphaproteobacteria bacterium]
MIRRNITTGKNSEAANAHRAGVRAAGEFLFTSGITPRDDDGNLVGAGDMAQQIGQTLANLEDVLEAGGIGYERVVKFTVFVTDIEAFISARREHDTGLERAMVASPALTLVEVSRLAHPDMMVEIEAIGQLV